MDIFGFRDVQDVDLDALERDAWQCGDTATAKLLAAAADGDTELREQIADLEKERDEEADRANKAEESRDTTCGDVRRMVEALDSLLAQIKPAKVRKALETALQEVYEAVDC